MTTPSSDSIGEKVRFWEEQDKINQEMIPRVIRQHELLTKHISEHDNLPEIVGRVLVRAQEEQNQQYENALASAKAQSDEHIQAATQALTRAWEEQNQQYENALASAIAQTNQQIEAATQALTTAREEQNQQYEDALTFAKAEYDKQVQDMRQESRKTRALLVGITVGACLIAITSLIVAIVT
jgi:predicted outer membrane protein